VYQALFDLMYRDASAEELEEQIDMVYKKEQPWWRCQSHSFTIKPLFHHAINLINDKKS
jgi:hypothetical protein